ncbi:ligase-associated DNA damage response endonuclease PdeM [Pedobacter sp. BS3]|uniref:ligase-associated DNA damage response endonuclease PdeM n=1 Tax=Pedobacter sp. BS3 TaxID=2567937 RepID=UPI0011EBFABC|nr:ligase-associated DNA damage response endonuclease PdeM [Pedobacter sp. BS3]TZF83985.1 ligase-associated DNA damage response endonuclease PdeM [Pedobacter sp. BS3]
MRINSHGEELILDEERALFWPEHHLLVISDLHLGKTAHFRRGGIQVPATLARTDLQRLSALFDKYRPLILLVTGDMFHHGLNTDIDEFEGWRKQYPHIRFILVKGNHDKLKTADYARLDIEICEHSFCLGPFCFIHDAPRRTADELYAISGHIHPGVSLSGKAKQRLRFPCFYFGRDYAILPAFSAFTGLSMIYPETGEHIYAIMPGKVLQV